MPLKARDLALTESQVACLIALRHRHGSKTAIAIQAKLDLKKAEAGLGILERFGLAEQDQSKRWHATIRGKTCSFESIPERRRRHSGLPSPGGQRLLDVLERPMRGSELVEKLGITHQRVRQLLVKLHSQGLVTFRDPGNPFWMVTRAGDETPTLTRDEERVLSVIPKDYVTTATKIRLSARLPEDKLQKMLGRLVASGFVEAFDGFRGQQAFRITVAGLSHPQFSETAGPARAPRLPVESDRVRDVLSALLDSAALRIRDLRDGLSIPLRSMNALMQYLKRKQLVKKTGKALSAPYSLTQEGHAVLAEMTRRKAA